MMEPIEAEVDGKQLRIFRCDVADAPIVYASMFMEVGRDLVRACGEIGCRPFHLVSISHLRWDEELSPWPHGPVVSEDDHFTGEAGDYARCLEDRIIPRAEALLGEATDRIIAGYSMGGLFALYAPYVTDRFHAAVSASGSVWYPGFTEFVRTHAFLRKPDAIYLSLGDQEIHTDNPVLNTTEHCMEELLEVYRAKGIPSTFELNPGNHYVDATRRLARGIVWTLDQISLQNHRPR